MFLDNIKNLAKTWNVKSTEKLRPIANEAMLYGMKLTNSPNTLKRLLNGLNVYDLDTTIATKTFKGNAYLLHKLPLCLVDKKAKIPNLHDYLYARNLLSPVQMEQLKLRVSKLKQVDLHSLYNGNVQNLINVYSKKGAFFSKLDSMYEQNKDFNQSVAAEALILLNTEFDKLNSYDEETVGRYFNTCLGRKSKTLISNGVTKSFTTQKETVVETIPALKVIKGGKEEFIPEIERKVETKRTVSIFQSFEEEDVAENVSFNSEAGKEIYEENFESFELKHDLEKILPPDLFNGVALYCGFASLEVNQDFENFLTSKGVKTKDLSDSKRRKYIELFVKAPVFTRLKQHPKVLQYFQAS